MPISISGQTRTPPALKWLLNEHAALLGDIQAMHVRRDTLAKQLRSIEGQQRKIQADVLALEQALVVKQAAADALNSTCQTAFNSADPTAGGVVHAWAGKYGKRGALKAYVRGVLESTCPKALSTTELVNLAIGHFGLAVLTPSERTTFRVLVSGYLRKMLSEGVVQALHRSLDVSRGAGAPNTVTGLWRWTPPVTLSALAARAKSLKMSHVDSTAAPAGPGAAVPNPSRCEVVAQ